jgi:hypothetical protein
MSTITLSTSPVYVWIKLSTAETDSFAYLDVKGLLFIGQVVSLACSTLAWGGLAANQVCIFVVANSGEKKPKQSDILESLTRLEPLSEEALIDSVVTSGSWLVAHPTSLSSIKSIKTLDLDDDLRILLKRVSI